MSYGDFWGMNVLGRESSRCKGFEIGLGLVKKRV